MRLLEASVGAGVEGPAVKALGPLFCLTEVYLWDDAKVRYKDASACVNPSVQKLMSSSTTVEVCSINSQTTDNDSSTEDLKLVSQMAALGLPISFSTTKEKSATARRKIRVKGQVIDQNVKNGSIRFPEVAELENDASLSITEQYNNLLLSNNQSEVQHETSIDFEEELSQGKDEKQSCSLLSCNVLHTSSDVADQSCAISTLSSSSCALTDHSDHAYTDNGTLLEFGEWSVIWDNFYRRNYFYNSQTQESTWHPPPGLEYLSFPSSLSVSGDLTTSHVDAPVGFQYLTDANQDQHADSLKDELAELHQSQNIYVAMDLSSLDTLETENSNGLVTSPSVLETLDMHNPIIEPAKDPFRLCVSDMKDHTTDHMIESFNREISSVYCETNESHQSGFIEIEGSPASTLDEVNCCHKLAIKKRRKAKRTQTWRRRLNVILYLMSSDQYTVCSGVLSASLEKYWCQRYSLFSLFDNGIKMDEEGWFSVTPESIARHHADRFGRGVVIDCFAGVGGNTIQCAKKSNYVISIDIDPRKVELAKHNAALYGVSDKIDFIVGDFFQLANYLKGDTIFLSPPWGGPDYVKVETYDIRSMLKPHDGYYLFKIATTIAPRVVLYLPRNVDMNQLAELCLSVKPPWTVEVEKNILNGKFKAVTAYFTCGA